MKSKITIAAILISVSASLANADSIKTFRQLCVANAGDPAAIAQAGNKAGFKMIDAVGGKVGFRKKTDESLQVNVATKHKFECAVTTSDISNPKQVTADFFSSLGLTPKGSKARGTIRGKTYTFLHDTKGGEAFVMYSD